MEENFKKGVDICFKSKFTDGRNLAEIIFEKPGRSSFVRSVVDIVARNDCLEVLVEVKFWNSNFNAKFDKENFRNPTKTSVQFSGF